MLSVLSTTIFFSKYVSNKVNKQITELNKQI